MHGLYGFLFLSKNCKECTKNVSISGLLTRKTLFFFDFDFRKANYFCIKFSLLSSFRGPNYIRLIFVSIDNLNSFFYLFEFCGITGLTTTRKFSISWQFTFSRVIWVSTKRICYWLLANKPRKKDEPNLYLNIYILGF